MISEKTHLAKDLAITVPNAFKRVYDGQLSKQRVDALLQHAKLLREVFQCSRHLLNHLQYIYACYPYPHSDTVNAVV